MPKDRIRIEYKYAARTELGLSRVEIIRLDRHESWFLIARLKVIVPVAIQSQDTCLFMRLFPASRTDNYLGDAMVAGETIRSL